MIQYVCDFCGNIMPEERVKVITINIDIYDHCENVNECRSIYYSELCNGCIEEIENTIEVLKKRKQNKNSQHEVRI